MEDCRYAENSCLVQIMQNKNRDTSNFPVFVCGGENCESHRCYLHLTQCPLSGDGVFRCDDCMIGIGDVLTPERCRCGIKELQDYCDAGPGRLASAYDQVSLRHVDQCLHCHDFFCQCAFEANAKGRGVSEASFKEFIDGWIQTARREENARMKEYWLGMGKKSVCEVKICEKCVPDVY